MVGVMNPIADISNCDVSGEVPLANARRLTNSDANEA